jgi:hemolysin activation/secretion protein
VRVAALLAVGVAALPVIPASVGRAAEASPAAAQSPVFDIHEFRVLGNSTLDARAIEAAVYPYLGDRKTFEDAEAARAALEARYHDRGYGTVLVDIPEQTVEDGVVRLRVTEGRLRASSVVGARYFSDRAVRRAVPEAAPGTVPALPVLQAQIAAVNAQTPDRTVVPVLKAGPYPGTVDLVLREDDHLPLHGSVELDNQYTFGSKPLRVNISVSYDNLFDHLDSISAQYQTSPQEKKDVAVFAAAYTRRLNDRGAHLGFSFIDSNSNLAALGAVNVIGAGKIYGAHLDIPAVAKPGQVQTVSLGLEYKDFGQNVNVSPISSVQSPISYLLASLTYAGVTIGPSRTWTWSASPAFAIRGVGSNPTAYDNKCFECRGNFFLLRVDASLRQHLPKGIDLVLRAAGQYAVEPVVTNEEFLLGGAQTVRGYYEAEELGDRGLRGTIELRGPSLFGGTGLRMAPLIYGDAGHINDVAPLAGQSPSVSLSSAGAGVDMLLVRTVTGYLTWAHVFSSGMHTEAGDSRWLFSVQGSW